MPTESLEKPVFTPQSAGAAFLENDLVASVKMLTAHDQGPKLPLPRSREVCVISAFSVETGHNLNVHLQEMQSRCI